MLYILGTTIILMAAFIATVLIEKNDDIKTLALYKERINELTKQNLHLTNSNERYEETISELRRKNTELSRWNKKLTDTLKPTP